MLTDKNKMTRKEKTHFRESMPVLKQKECNIAALNTFMLAFNLTLF